MNFHLIIKFQENMRWFIFGILLYFYITLAECLWTKGVVHYAINKKDYDIHSQDIIMSTFEKIQREICVKFFHTPFNYSASDEDKILYISNADKRKNCPPEQYDFEGSVVDMPIGYKCLNERDITRLVIDMLRASIAPQGSPPNSFDLVRKFQEQDESGSRTLLTAKDRNFINTHYHHECGDLLQKPTGNLRRSGKSISVSEENEVFYKHKLWPLGIVMYGTEKGLERTPDFQFLLQAMATVEVSSCIVFQRAVMDDILVPKNFLWFTIVDGETMPRLGVMAGNQTLILHSMVHGAPGHQAHTVNMLLRVLGIPMMSNRFDRDNYVTVRWKNVQKGMEHYLERLPEQAILKNSDGEEVPYDYSSVTHAPANYLCKDCSLGQQTVTPLQDHLWQKSLTMGHRSDLDPTDIETLNLLYSKQCQSRFFGKE